MSNNESVVFDRAINRSIHYLEFGLGGNSSRVTRKSKAKIYTVESRPEWIAYMREYMIVKHSEHRRLSICPVDIGPTRAWGHPQSNDSQNLFSAYSSTIFRVIDAMILDLALIDGRFRVACTLKLILECHKNSDLKILIHDF